MQPIKHILVATDFGESSDRAVELATDLAATLGATLTLFHSCEIPALGLDGAVPFPVDLITTIYDEAARTLAQRLAEVKKVLPGTRSALCSANPCDGLLAMCEEQQVDLVVMGTHGRRGLSRALLGSVAERTVRLAKVPVLTVPVSAATECRAA